MKIGDYVRTNNGLIFKIVGGNEDNWRLDIEYSKLEYMEDTWLELYKYNDNGGWFIRENCKSSPNIIDLIAVGDIIKYHPVQNNYVKTNILYKSINNGRALIELEYDITHNKKSIISIVTKEKFKEMEYEVR